MKIIISGASSPIGASLAEYAVQEGIDVLAIVRQSSKNIANLPKSPKIKILYADLSQYSKLDAPSSDYDVFFHLAWDKTFIFERDDVDNQIDNAQRYRSSEDRIKFRSDRLLSTSTDVSLRRYQRVEIRYGLAAEIFF